MNSVDKVFKQLRNTIVAIHDAPHKAVIEYAGAGSQAILWLHSVGGSSRTLLEAVDRYAARSLIGLLGFEPEQFTAPQVAQLMANKAYLRALALTKDESVLGIGCTAAIATDRAKKGEHRCVICVRSDAGITTYSLEMQKDTRSREEEEALVSLLVLSGLAQGSGVCAPPLPLLGGERVVVEEGSDTLLQWTLEHYPNWVSVDERAIITAGNTLPAIALLSGAFNPLHEGHRQLASVASDMLDQPVYFELPLNNADKASIPLDEAQRRVNQFRGVGTVILSRSPLFSQKAEIFPGSVFVIGADTAERLVQPRFYQDDVEQMRQSLKFLLHKGCRFLVAGRRSEGRFLTLDHVDIPDDYRCLFETIPEERFRNDISSTVLRAANRKPLK